MRIFRKKAIKILTAWRLRSCLSAPHGVFRLSVLHVVYFDIIVDDERNFSRYRHFLGHFLPQNREFPEKANLGLFGAISETFLHYYSCFWVVCQWNIKNHKKIIMNIINDIIKTRFFAIFSLWCGIFSKLSSKIYCILYCAANCSTIAQCDAIMTSSNTNWVSYCNAEL